MRILHQAVAIPLVGLVACVAAPSDDSVGVEQGVHRTPDFEKLYDRFEGEYDVASFTDLVVRTGGLEGAPVQADFYFPDGCTKGKRGKAGKKRKAKREDKKWKYCRDGKGRRGRGRKDRGDFADAFPLVPLLQGGNVPRAQYSEFAEELASYGFVVVVTDLKRAFGPPGSPELFLTSQWVTNWVADDVALRDADAASPLHEIVDASRMGVVGHSFGAATALAAVQGRCEPPFCFGPPFSYQRPAALQVAVAHGLQVCDATNGQCFDADTSAAPTMIVNGGLDDPGAPTQEAYESLEPARSLVVLEQVNHFGLTNDDLSTPGGRNPEPNELDQDLSISRTARWTALWLSTYLLGDEVATSLVFESGGVEGAVVTSEM